LEIRGQLFGGSAKGLSVLLVAADPLEVLEGHGVFTFLGCQDCVTLALLDSLLPLLLFE